MALTSDPLTWLRPIWRRLVADPRFRMRSAQSQFAALREAVGESAPQHAARMPEYSPATVQALLRHLDANLDTEAAQSVRSKLWTATLRGRSLECVAVYLPSGIDVRLLEGEDFRRTQLTRTAPEAANCADRWRSELQRVGWSVA